MINISCGGKHLLQQNTARNTSHSDNCKRQLQFHNKKNLQLTVKDIDNMQLFITSNFPWTIEASTFHAIDNHFP